MLSLAHCGKHQQAFNDHFYPFRKRNSVRLLFTVTRKSCFSLLYLLFLVFPLLLPIFLGKSLMPFELSRHILDSVPSFGAEMSFAAVNFAIWIGFNQTPVSKSIWTKFQIIFRQQFQTSVFRLLMGGILDRLRPHFLQTSPLKGLRHLLLNYVVEIL